MEKQKGVHNNSVRMYISTCLCDVYDHSLLGHGRVGHVVEHPWQVDLFLWEAAVSMVE